MGKGGKPILSSRVFSQAFCWQFSNAQNIVFIWMANNMQQQHNTNKNITFLSSWKVKQTPKLINMLVALKVILENSGDWAGEGRGRVRGDVVHLESVSCRLQAVSHCQTCTLPPCLPYSLFDINLKMDSKSISVLIYRYQTKETSQAVLLKHSQSPLRVLHFSAVNNCNTL